MNPETRIKNSILRELGKEPDLQIWNHPVGLFRTLYDENQVVRVGTPGQADLMAVVAVKITPAMVGRTIGVAWGLEVKTPSGTQDPEQVKWEAAIKRRGGVYTLARSPKQAREQFEEIKRGNYFRAQ